MVTELTLTGTDATPLAARRWPAERPKAVVQIVHGMAEHSARYNGLAAVLNADGYSVYAGDHRGHGETAAASGSLGTFAPNRGWSLVVDDVHALTAEIRRQEHDLPIFLLGHSMGSILARDVAIRYGADYAGVVLTGVIGPMGLAGLAVRVIAAAERRLRGYAAPSPLLDRLAFGGYNKRIPHPRSKFDWLSRDDAVVDAYVADPACGFVCSNSFYNDLVDGLKRVHDPRLLRRIPKSLPFLLAVGSDDSAAGYGKVLVTESTLLRRAGLSHVTTLSYPGARHEIFNETNRDEVERDVVAWLDAHLPAQSPNE